MFELKRVREVLEARKNTKIPPMYIGVNVLSISVDGKEVRIALGKDHYGTLRDTDVVIVNEPEAVEPPLSVPSKPTVWDKVVPQLKGFDWELAVLHKLEAQTAKGNLVTQLSQLETANSSTAYVGLVHDGEESKVMQWVECIDGVARSRYEKHNNDLILINLPRKLWFNLYKNLEMSKEFYSQGSFNTEEEALQGRYKRPSQYIKTYFIEV